MRPRLEFGSRTRGFERGVEPGVEDLDGGFRRCRHAGYGENVGVVDGTGVLGVTGGDTSSGKDTREFVGEDSHADPGTAGDEASGFDGVGGCRADAAADFGSDGVVGVVAKVFNIDVEGTEVRDEGVFQVATEGIGPSYDL